MEHLVESGIGVMRRAMRGLTGMADDLLSRFGSPDQQFFMSSMSSILTTPWTPVLDGRRCARYAPYDEIVEEGAMPNAVHSPGWNLESLEPQLAETPDGKGALWEGILALWRLNLLAREGTNDEGWRNLVSAWLVRTC